MIKLHWFLCFSLGLASFLLMGVSLAMFYLCFFMGIQIERFMYVLAVLGVITSLIYMVSSASSQTSDSDPVMCKHPETE